MPETGTSLETMCEGFGPIAQDFGMEWGIHDTADRMKVVIMVSNFGHCLNDLLYRWRIGALPIDIVGVTSNHMTYQKLVVNHDLPFHHIKVTKENKPEAEAQLLQVVEDSGADLVVLARYVQILSDSVCQKMSGQIPGIGRLTATTMLIDMPELGHLESKKIASLAGLAPMTQQSGKWQGKERITGGRSSIRRAIYMPVLVAIRFNRDLHDKYQQLLKAGKAKKVAITAIMRRIIILANTLLRERRDWLPEQLAEKIADIKSADSYDCSVFAFLSEVSPKLQQSFIDEMGISKDSVAEVARKFSDLAGYKLPLAI